jgi:hypothetical protein
MRTIVQGQPGQEPISTNKLDMGHMSVVLDTRDPIGRRITVQAKMRKIL